MLLASRAAGVPLRSTASEILSIQLHTVSASVHDENRASCRALAPDRRLLPTPPGESVRGVSAANMTKTPEAGNDRSD